MCVCGGGGGPVRSTAITKFIMSQTSKEKWHAATLEVQGGHQSFQFGPTNTKGTPTMGGTLPGPT